MVRNVLRRVAANHTAHVLARSHIVHAHLKSWPRPDSRPRPGVGTEGAREGKNLRKLERDVHSGRRGALRG